MGEIKPPEVMWHLEPLLSLWHSPVGSFPCHYHKAHSFSIRKALAAVRRIGEKKKKIQEKETGDEVLVFLMCVQRERERDPAEVFLNLFFKLCSFIHFLIFFTFVQPTTISDQLRELRSQFTRSNLEFY